jgi:hypothetical protein
MTKVTIIYAPDIDPGLLHFSRILGSQSARLRKYENPGSPPTEIHEYRNKRSEIEKRIKKEYELGERERKNIKDTGYWYNYICGLER